MMASLATRALAAAALASSLAAAPAMAQDYPNDTIRVIVPYSAGGGTDTIARAFAAEMEKIAAQPVIVENVPGAGGAVGYKKLVNSRPDGYTLLLTSDGDLTAQVATQAAANIDLDKSSCVGVIFDTPTWMLSHADNGFKDLGDFFAAAKADPGGLNVGITARKGLTDFAAQSVQRIGDVDFRIIPFGNGADLSKAMQANQVQAGIIVSPVLLGEVQAGNLTVLAAGNDLGGITDEALRDTKTFMDYGATWGSSVNRGIMLPADTPEEIRAKVEELAKQATESEGFRAFGENFGFAPKWTDAKAFCADLRDQVETFSELSKETGN